MKIVRRPVFAILIILGLLSGAACAARDSEQTLSAPGETAGNTTDNQIDDQSKPAASLYNAGGQETDHGRTPGEIIQGDGVSGQQQEAASDPGLEPPVLTEQDSEELSPVEYAPEDTDDPPQNLQTGPTEPPAPDRQDSEPVVLTICGDGVVRETAWTLSQLQSMSDGYREYIFSTTNNWPNFGHMTARGVSLPYLLQQAYMTNNSESFILTSTDGYRAVITLDQMYGARYAYADHSRDGSDGASRVEPVVAWEWGEDGKVRPDDLRFFIGQCGPMEVNTSTFVMGINKIEVLTSSCGRWDIPAADISDGSVVPFGTELHLLHDDMDSVRIYYTLDGSEPDYNSSVYNGSTTFFQPHLIAPVFLAKSVTVRAFAAGIGRDPSPVVTLTYTVEEP